MALVDICVTCKLTIALANAKASFLIKPKGQTTVLFKHTAAMHFKNKGAIRARATVPKHFQVQECFLDASKTVRLPSVRAFHGVPSGQPDPVMATKGRLLRSLWLDGPIGMFLQQENGW